MQICNSPQTDNHAGTPPLSFLQAGCPSCHPNNNVKALKANYMLPEILLWLVLLLNQTSLQPQIVYCLEISFHKVTNIFTFSTCHNFQHSSSHQCFLACAFCHWYQEVCLRKISRTSQRNKKKTKNMCTLKHSKPFATVKVATAHIIADHRSFDRIRQVAPGVPSNTWFCGAIQ